LLIPPESHPSADLLAAAKMLAALVTAAPALPIGMQASASAIESLMQSSADSRLATLLREGAVNLETGDSDQLPSDPAEKGNAIPVATLAYLTRIGAAAEVKELLAETARHLVKPTKEEEDRARSAAEQFLFRVLELLPATAGRFKLNERLEFQHGPRSAEGDLVAAAERVAIELDGHYYHLADAEAYRRDRKKDYSYQRHGYLILRFLSEDVVARLEEIVKRITEAIEDNEG
jgi:very-short-patch-repair endonuclease